MANGDALHGDLRRLFWEDAGAPPESGLAEVVAEKTLAVAVRLLDARCTRRHRGGATASMPTSLRRGYYAGVMASTTKVRR